SPPASRSSGPTTTPSRWRWGWTSRLVVTARSTVTPGARGSMAATMMPAPPACSASPHDGGGEHPIGHVGEGNRERTARQHHPAAVSVVGGGDRRVAATPDGDVAGHTGPGRTE